MTPKLTTNFGGDGPLYDPEPEPSDVGCCGRECEVVESKNEGVEGIITSYVHECRECGARYIDRASVGR
jgi:hypothetical protein